MFKNTKRQLPMPFVIYADFECYTQKINESQHGNTTKYQRHVPSGFSYMIVSTAPQHTQEPVVYRGEKVVETFLDRLLEEHYSINTILSHVQPMVLSPEEEAQHQRATDCFICGEPFGAERPVRDHDHLTGKYRGPAHSECNLLFKYQRFNNNRKNPVYVVPVVFHNLRGYDGHLLIEAIGKYKQRRITCIANNSERYISICSGSLRFIDSIQFMGASLEQLVNNLQNKEFKLLRKYIDGRTSKS